jgi:hypothetical protein
MSDPPSPPPPPPFVVPGSERDPDKPLCPWARDRGEDEKYYRSVGGHAAAYARFRQEVGQVGAFFDQGAVVVVSGPERSGKTALIHRCVQWLSKAMDSQVPILNYSDVQLPVKAVDEHTAEIAKKIKYDLLRLRPPDWIRDELKPENHTIDVMLQLLSGFCDNTDQRKPHENFILLPPSMVVDTAQQEIERYRGNPAPGVVIFLEHSTESEPAATDHRPRPPIRLHLRHLSPGEALTLVKLWPGRPETMPSITEDTMTKLESSQQGQRLSTGMWLAVLRHIFALRDRPESSYRGLDVIDYVEVLEALLDLIYQLSAVSIEKRKPAP